MFRIAHFKRSRQQFRGTARFRGSAHEQKASRPVPAADLAIMLDELHLDFPFAGSRMPRDQAPKAPERASVWRMLVNLFKAKNRR
jgi:hypothetical protein